MKSLRSSIYRNAAYGIFVFVVGASMIIFTKSPIAFLWFIGLLCLVEVGSYFLVCFVRKNFPWFIMPKDFFPPIDKQGLKEFIKHGYDSELGWVRKPLTQKDEIGQNGSRTQYTINAFGGRSNPGHEELKSLISCYGDSFTFCRQVNDHETFEWYLSKITKTNVLNFGVGNYGLDQSILRLFREYPSNKTKIVIMGVVPSTIVRILCVWKHYNEFGNALGFKPRFQFSAEGIELVRNLIDTEEKLDHYKDFISEINKYDEFYETKFKKEMLGFPYFISIMADPMRNISIIAMVLWRKFLNKGKKGQPYPPAMKVIMDRNLKLRVSLFNKNREAVALLQQLIEKFIEYGKKNDFTPVFLWMPQKDDILHIREKKDVFYGQFISQIQEKLVTIDLTDLILHYEELDELYSDDNQYGGHHTKKANSIIADFINTTLMQRGIYENKQIK
ncbi:MAG: hypothetical protein A2103_04220 [Gammaproteobacteria bacterium GWF2_41_13]|nr:MAG: hypothetical protein A2103_04220 [Gammaproteobacteria bacterium GWF2_41_13]